MVSRSNSRIAVSGWLVEAGDVGLEVHDGCPVNEIDAREHDGGAGHLEELDELSPIGLTRRGPRVAKMPIVRRWLRSRNGICRSGRRRRGREGGAARCSRNPRARPDLPR